MPERSGKFTSTGGLTFSQCVRCKHFTGESTCNAFPNGIPTEILANEYDHTIEFPGDHGIQFETLRGTET